MKHSRSSRTGQSLSDTATPHKRRQERKNQQNPRKLGANTINLALPVKKILVFSEVAGLFSCKSLIINNL